MDRLKLTLAFFRADFETGVLYWRDDVPGEFFASEKMAARYLRKYAGRVVKTYRINPFGHLSAQIRHHGGSVNVLAHRAIWALAKNVFPPHDVDHINNDPTDNRLVNLRAATRGQNADNALRRKDGFKGAYRAKDGGRWFSAVWDGKRLVHLGMFDTPEAAHNAWARAKADIAGGFFNPGYASVFD